MIDLLLRYTQADWEYLKKCTLKVTVRPSLSDEREETFISTIEKFEVSPTSPFEPLAIKFKENKIFYNFNRIKTLEVVKKPTD